MNDYDDIEILDIFEDKKPTIDKPIVIEENFIKEPIEIKKKIEEPEVEKKEQDSKDKQEIIKEEVKQNKREKNKKSKTRIIQIIFCSISALFILSCCVFYGYRLIKYYKIYNPSNSSGEKTLLLSNKIGQSEIVYEGSGLYISGGNYIYKGEVENNYLKYNNMLWRIVKVNNNGTIQIVLDDYINILEWNKEISDYENSSINEYLNNVFLKALNKDLLAKSNYCTDKLDDLTAITCDKQNNNDYVTLLDVTSYLNSVVDKKTYLSSEDEIFWLNNYGSEKVWHTNGNNVSQSDANSLYEVRPMVTLKGTLAYISGDGTKENPYKIEQDNEIGVGSIVKLGEDNWVIYEKDENIKLTLMNNLEKQYRFDKTKVTFDIESKDSLAEYLNTTYLEELSYKDLLEETEWYIGSYENNYSDVKKEKVKAKIGLLNMMDLKFDSSIDGYFLSTAKDEDYVYVYEEILRPSKPSTYRNIRPCIALDKNIKLTGEGTIDSPYEVEE